MASDEHLALFISGTSALIAIASLAASVSLFVVQQRIARDTRLADIEVRHCHLFIDINRLLIEHPQLWALYELSDLPFGVSFEDDSVLRLYLVHSSVLDRSWPFGTLRVGSRPARTCPRIE